jgi:hypothetical protein
MPAVEFGKLNAPITLVVARVFITITATTMASFIEEAASGIPLYAQGSSTPNVCAAMSMMQAASERAWDEAASCMHVDTPPRPFGLLDLGPKIIEPGHAPEDLSTDPGMTYTYFDIYLAKVPSSDAFAEFLARVEPAFLIIKMMGDARTVLLRPIHVRPTQLRDILSHCVVRGPTPHAQTIHGTETELPLWHLSNTDDSGSVEFYSGVLYTAGASEVELVVELKPSAIKLPPPAVIAARSAAFQAQRQKSTRLQWKWTKCRFRCDLFSVSGRMLLIKYIQSVRTCMHTLRMMWPSSQPTRSSRRHGMLQPAPLSRQMQGPALPFPPRRRLAEPLRRRSPSELATGSGPCR